MKKIALILVVLITRSIVMNAQSADTNCKTLDQVVNESLAALEKNDTTKFLSMLNYEKWVEILSEEGKTNANAAKDVARLKGQKKEWTDHQSMDFLMLMGNVKQIAGGPVDFKIVQTKEISTENLNSGCVTHNIKVNVTINGKPRMAILPISEYKGCFYYFKSPEPLFVRE